MEHQASVVSLFIVIIVAFLTPIMQHRLKLAIIPVVVAEILMGLIIGKSGLNLVQEDVVTGSKEYVEQLKRELEFCQWC